MAKVNETDYAYSVARIRAIETKLLDQSRFDRMMEARSAQDALKVLTDAEYGLQIREAVDVFDYERLISEEMEKCYMLLQEIAPEPEIFTIFKQRNDYQNAKIILKSEFLGIDPEQLVKTGTIEPNKLKIIIKERNFQDLPIIMREALQETIENFGRTGDPQMIDIIMDNASYRQMVKSGAGLDIPFLSHLTEAIADITNIRIFIRVKSLNRSWDFMRKVLVPGGSISDDRYFEGIDKNLDSFFESLRYTRYSSVADNGFTALKGNNFMTLFEKYLDDYLIEYAGRAKYIALGAEPLIGYLIAKENELKNVRIIMTGKINQVPVDEIKERLRVSYV